MCINSSRLMFAAGLLLGFLSLRFALQLNLSTKWTIEATGNTMSGGTRAHEHSGRNKQPDRNVASNATRVLCWVLTGPKTLNSRAKHIKETWAKHCNKPLYMSSQTTGFPTVGLNVSEAPKDLYQKTVRALQYIHQNHFQEADWFLKADDDTFVVVENLQYLLSKFSPEEPVYLGRRFQPPGGQAYMSGAAGYVLSKEALRRFIEGFRSGKCTHSSPTADQALGRCMDAVGVRPADSRDVKRRETFLDFSPEHHLVRHFIKPKPGDYHSTVEGPECCSDFAVSFHYTSAVQLYVLDYLTYRLRPFGYRYKFNPDGSTSNNKTHGASPEH